MLSTMPFRILQRLALGSLLLSCAGASLFAYAQSDKPTATGEQPPIVIRTNARMVQLSVVAQDGTGRPVTGLARDDFTLLDNDSPQTIAHFEQVGGPRSPSTPRPLPPNVYTNRLDVNQVPGNVTVVLLDTLNTRLEDQFYVRKQIVSFLEQLQPQDHVAVYALATKLYIIHDFTQDTRELIAAVQQYKAQTSGRLDASRRQSDFLGGNSQGVPQIEGLPPNVGTVRQRQVQAMRDLFDGTMQKQQDMAVVNRAELTTSAIEAIANHLAPIPGRKNLVWVSGGFPLAIGPEGLTQLTRKYSTEDVRNFEHQLNRTARALNQANLAIYPVDARGLTSSVSYDAVNPVRVTTGHDHGDSTERDTTDFASMDLLAEQTGGRSSHNSNDLTGAVRRALADGEITYQLAFYPSFKTWDGKYHRLKLHVNRPGIQLTYRKGYFATPDSANSEAEQNAQMAAVARSPIDAANLSILARFYPPETADSKVAGLSMTFDLRQIDLRDTADGENCLLEFVFIQQDDSGKQFAGEDKRADVNLPRQKYESFLQTGMPVTDHLKIADGATMLKIVVRDRRSGSIGSLTIPLR
jgi:VWFA-related protein